MNTNKIVENENIKDIEKNITDLNSFKDNIETTAPKYKDLADKKEELAINRETTERVIKEVSRQQEITFTQALYAACDIYQKGGHLKNVVNRTTYINGLTITKQNITQAAIRLGVKISHRMMARSIRDIILNSSRARQIPGNLFAQYRLYLITKGITLDDATTEEHSYYCTDFHIDNPSAPAEVAKFLITRTRTRNAAKKKD